MILLAAVLFGLAPTAAAGKNLPPSTTVSQSADSRISDLIDRLQSDDASQRESAAAALIAIGTPARSAILKTVRSDDPGLRQEAAHVLLGLPWYRPGDPPQVRQLLLLYGAADAPQRGDVIDALADLPGEKGIPILIRLLNEDPRPQARWYVVTSLRQRDAEPRLAPFRAIQPPADNPPMLAVCGYAWLNFDLPTAISDLRRSAELEFTDPTEDGGEFDYIIHILTAYACDQKNYNLAADLRRRQFARGGESDTQGVPTSLLELFALQGDFGPLKGLDGDEKLAGPNLKNAMIQYALSRMYAREGNAVLAGQARDAAFKVSTTPQQRQDAGEFLYDHGWNNLAEREYDDLLRMDADIAAPGRAEADANAHFRLAGIALIRGDDLAVARNKEQAMKLLGNDADLAMTDNQGRQWPISNSDLWADIHWHYLRAALARHDDSEAQQQVGQLLALKPTDPDIALDAVPFLTRLGRTADAQAIFDSAFTAMKARLNADPKNPELLNAIAWLCAQCDRKLPEARAWARQAGDLMPNDAAIIDTLADVNFQLGNAKEAARLETKALQLDPGDDFMTAQLHRFRAAATRPSAAPN